MKKVDMGIILSGAIVLILILTQNLMGDGISFVLAPLFALGFLVLLGYRIFVFYKSSKNKDIPSHAVWGGIGK